jgi:hypothetical protein
MMDKGKEAKSGLNVRLGWLLQASWLVPCIVLLLLTLYSAQYTRRIFISTLSMSLLVAVAALAIGALLGFLFGIPRALQLQSTTSPDASHVTAYAVNTNLEQISDWLTKILVGVGLIQLGRIGAQFARLTAAVGSSMGGKPIGQYAAGADIVFFLLWGFLLGYLLTRTYLTAAFRAFDVIDRIADEAAQKAATAASQGVENQLRRQEEIDAEALSLAFFLLTPGSTSDTVPDEASQRRFEEVIGQASLPIREQVYQLARSQRAANWSWRERTPQDDGAKKRHERTLPVIQALSKVDPDNNQIHSDLGFALKDKENPDYGRAIQELSIAVDLGEKLGDARNVAWAAVNRALARISLGNQNGGDVAPWSNRAEILADIRRAEEFGGGPGRIAHSHIITAWRSQNT